MRFNIQQNQKSYYLCFDASGVQPSENFFTLNAFDCSWNVKLKSTNPVPGSELIGYGEVAVEREIERSGMLPINVNISINPIVKYHNGWLVVEFVKFIANAPIQIICISADQQ